MANFCKRCGTALNLEYGLCPVCDKDAIEAKIQETVALEEEAPAKVYSGFCMNCGTALNPQTGECPNCAVTIPSEPSDNNEKAKKKSTSKSSKRKKNSSDKKNSVLSKPLCVFLTIILSIIVFVTTLVPVVALSVRSATTYSGVSEILSNVDLIDLMKAVPISDEYSNENYDNLYDGISYVITEYLGGTASEKRMRYFLEQSNMLDEMANLVVSYADDVFSGKSRFSFSSGDLADILYENKRCFDLAFATDMTREDFEVFAVFIIGESTEKIYPATLRSEEPALMGFIQYGCSYVAIVLMFAVSLVLVVVMVILCKCKRAFLGSGISISLVGVVTCALLFLSTVGYNALNAILGGKELIAGIFAEFIKYNSLIYIIVLILGLVLLFSGIILYVIQRKKKADDYSNEESMQMTE